MHPLVRSALSSVRTVLNIIIDFVYSPLTLLSAILLRSARERNFRHFRLSKSILLRVGVFPIVDHYYEPLFHPRHLSGPSRVVRNLPGINLNDREQLEVLGSFTFNAELEKFPVSKPDNPHTFYYNNDAFCSGDAEYLYNVIRRFEPRKVIEIGSGYSTLMAAAAIKANATGCQHTCIEPFEHPWLDQIGVEVIRERVERIDLSLFKSLQANDILFIDSSHMIRPQGDVLFEYLEILPVLQKGVLVHIHDISTPYDYPREMLGRYFWNEQYLLEAFLSLNSDYRIIAALNYLSHRYTDEFSSKCPVFKTQIGREPGSFWMVRQ